MYTKKVKRRYFNKRLNQWVEREYIYKDYSNDSNKRRRASEPQIIDESTDDIRDGIQIDLKKAKKSRKRVGKLLLVGKGKKKTYDDRIDEILSTLDDLADRAELEAKIHEAIRKGERLSIKGALSSIATSKIEKMFINAGYTAETIEEIYGIPSDILFDPQNWDHSRFSYGGQTFEFQWGYDQSNLIEV